VSAAASTPGAALEAAVAHARGGGLVAFPTETVYGLGADARSEPGLARLRRWKGRGASQPVSILAKDLGAAARLGLEVGEAARRLAAAFWPGPLTLVLPGGTARFASGVARADGAVGVRCSPHPVAAALAAALSESASALTATSLNRHGEPPARSRADARALCDDADPDAPHLLESGPDAGSAGLPSSVLDLTTEPPRLLRAGAIGAGELARALGREVASR
jgi:L-threonylcarbamoyladenylate synthase